MKNFVFVLLVFIFAVQNLSARGNGSGTQVLRVAFNQTSDHPQYIALQELSEAFAEETDDAYRLEISTNAVLGDQRATAELVQSGAIQMAVVANPIIENFNPDFAILGLPYVYDNIEHQKRYAHKFYTRLTGSI